MHAIGWLCLAMTACGGCSGHSAVGSVDATSARGQADDGGTRAITYTTSDGTEDREWIYVAPGPPDAPIVVIAHGQGTDHIINCWPTEIPHDSTVQQAARLADLVAAEGYTAVAIAYRNAGDGQPAVPALRTRDLYLRDAAAVLAAARDVRDRRHVDRDVPVALIGHSNGTYAAWWAATDRPELAELQRGLDIRTLVLGGHTANSLANLVAVRGPVTGVKKDRQMAIIGTTLLAVSTAIDLAGVAQIDTANLDDGSSVATLLAPLVTAKGLAAFRSTFLTRVTAASARCRAGVPVACDSGCVEDVLAAAPDPGAVTDYVTQTTLDGVDAWNPDVFAVPTGTNPIVVAGRTVSPPFYTGHLLAPRALVEYSASDHVIVPHGQATRDGTLAALRGQGATVTSPAIASDARGVCEHADYWDSTRACGFAQIIAELHAALDERTIRP